MHSPQPHPHDTDDTLSAFIDGELADDMARQALRQLTANAAARSRHAEYCAIGDVLRGYPVDRSSLTAKVMAALEHEPTLLAPMRRPADRRPALWLAAAAVTVLTWGLWSALPRQEAAAQIAAVQPNDAQAYLAAHQDFAQAVMSTPDMNYSRVSLAEAGR